MRIINRLKWALYIILNILLNLNSSARFTYTQRTQRSSLAVAYTRSYYRAVTVKRGARAVPYHSILSYFL